MTGSLVRRAAGLLPSFQRPAFPTRFSISDFYFLRRLFYIHDSKGGSLGKVLDFANQLFVCVCVCVFVCLCLCMCVCVFMCETFCTGLEARIGRGPLGP